MFYLVLVGIAFIFITSWMIYEYIHNDESLWDCLTYGILLNFGACVLVLIIAFVVVGLAGLNTPDDDYRVLSTESVEPVSIDNKYYINANFENDEYVYMYRDGSNTIKSDTLPSDSKIHYIAEDEVPYIEAAEYEPKNKFMRDWLYFPTLVTYDIYVPEGTIMLE